MAWEIHLGSKAESLQRLSEKLNISLDSFVFLDDNSFEVEDVSRSLPDVLVIHVPGNLGNEDELTRSLQHCWVLDAFTGKVVTKEDQQRPNYISRTLQGDWREAATAIWKIFWNLYKLKLPPPAKHGWQSSIESAIGTHQSIQHDPVSLKRTWSGIMVCERSSTCVGSRGER